MSASCPMFGFRVAVEFPPDASAEDRATMLHGFQRLLDEQSLDAKRYDGRDIVFVVTRTGSQATHADRELVMEWAGRHATQATIAASDLLDLSEEA